MKNRIPKELVGCYNKGSTKKQKNHSKKLERIEACEVLWTNPKLEALLTKENDGKSNF